MSEEQDIKLRIQKINEMLLNKNIKAYEIENLYREYIKLSVCLGTNRPKFEENKKQYEHVNCYAYALGLSLPDSFYNRYNEVDDDGIRYNIGFISKQLFAFNKEQQLYNLYKDLEALNIQFYETNQSALNEHGGYKIAVYNNCLDFHMKRQNCDGSWSEKMGYTFNFKQSDSIKEYHNSYTLVKVLEIVKPTIK